MPIYAVSHTKYIEVSAQRRGAEVKNQRRHGCLLYRLDCSTTECRCDDVSLTISFNSNNGLLIIPGQPSTYFNVTYCRFIFVLIDFILAVLISIYF